METTDMQAIREALEDAYKHFLAMRQIATGPFTLAAANMSIDKNRDALAILDKIDKSGEGVSGICANVRISADPECGCNSCESGHPDQCLVVAVSIERLGYGVVQSAPAKAPAEVVNIEVREALNLGLRVANEIRRTYLPGPINSDVLGAIHTFERAADVILSNTPEHGN